MQKATRQQTKDHNTRLVLKTIFQQGEISRAEVARITNLTRTTVSDITGTLFEEELLEETGVGSSVGGKPPILLHVPDDARQLICLDLGCHEFRGALVNLRGGICSQKKISIDKPDHQSALQLISSLVDSLEKEARAPLIGIGVGVAGLTDIGKGTVQRSVCLGWTDFPLKKLLADQYNLPVYLLNDSHAAALAEYTYGEFRKSPNLIVVQIGEGIGAGIILSGQIHYGDGYGAGEIGHLTVVEGGRKCSCGNFGCLETIASPPALLQRVRELAEYELISFPLETVSDPSQISWDSIRQAFEAGDDTVTELVKEAGRYLGISIANFVSILNVHRIVIAGSLVPFGEKFLASVSNEVKQRALLSMVEETRISHSTLGPDNVILGASALVLSNEMGLP